MAGVTLDSGALIAADKNDRAFWSMWKEVIVGDDLDVTVPAAVLAQVWRGNSAGIARVLKSSEVQPLDEVDAKAVGVLLAASRTSDVIDAAVVQVAARRGDKILTSDPGDIERLAAAAGKTLPVVRL